MAHECEECGSVCVSGEENEMAAARLDIGLDGVLHDFFNFILAPPALRPGATPTMIAVVRQNLQSQCALSPNQCSTRLLKILDAVAPQPPQLKQKA